MDSDEPLLALAGNILDGTASDWAELESTALSTLSESQRAVFGELRAIAAVRSLHRTNRLGECWSHLRIDGVIGRGSFGTVYRAWDLQLDREVALKILSADPESESLAITEARLLAKLHDANVVTVYGADRIGSHAGLWMELVHGETLEQLVRRRAGTLTAAEVADIAVQLCRAVAVVHGAGVLHGDIKAHNVMLQPNGRVVLMDFGAGRLRASDAARMAGTPLYLAPEVCAGGVPGEQSDVYSLGVLLYYLLTGTYPVLGRSMEEIRERHKESALPQPVRMLRPDLPRRMAAAITTAIEPLPARRWQTAVQFGDALSSQPHVLGKRSASLAATLLISAGLLAFSQFGRVHSESPQTATTHRLALPDAFFGNGLAFGGRYFSYTTGDGAVALFDLMRQGSETLVPASGDEFAQFAISSPDAQLVAYEWWTTRESYELRMFDRRARTVRTLVRDDSLGDVLPVDWTHDGASLLVIENETNGKSRIAIISTTTGQRQLVRAIDGAPPLGASISADARFVVYDTANAAVPYRRELHVVSSNDLSDVTLSLGPEENAWSPLWTPDGSHVFFLSDRAGTIDGWVVSVSEGRMIGEPELAARNLARATSLGITSNGAYYYRLRTGTFDVDVVPVDPQTLQRTGSARPAAKRPSGSNIGVSYSPDGSRLLYVSVRDGLGSDHDNVIVIQDRRSGRERLLKAEVDAGPAPPRWSPDGRYLLMRGLVRGQGRGIFVVDVETGAIRTEIVRFADKHMTDYSSIGWYPDGRAVVYEDASRGLVKHTLSTHAEHVIYPYSRNQAHGRIHRFSFASAGEPKFAFSAPSRVEGESMLIAVDQGAAREVASTHDGFLVFQGWTPDGQEIVYSLADRTSAPHTLWRVSAYGGPPQPLGVEIRGATQINPVAISPAGSEIAFTAGTPKSEIWMMENFLPR